MKLLNKLVLQTPLKTLWTDTHELQAKRVAAIAEADIKRLLQKGTVQFVVAAVGYKLRWIALQHCFTFWKNEVKNQLATDDLIVAPYNFPNEYAYWASLWMGDDVVVPIVLLEKSH